MTKFQRMKNGYQSRLYRIWHNMKGRALAKNIPPEDRHYILYKHVTLFKPWNAYLVFKKWAEKNGYKDNLLIDRIDSSKGYCPSNCRWVTIKESNNNLNKNTPKVRQQLKNLAEMKKKKVLCVEAGIVFNSLQEPSWLITNGKNQDLVSQAVRRKQRCCGYYWRLV